MYLLPNLKKEVIIEDFVVECPVVGCKNFVERQKSKFLRKPQFFCKQHRIYISPSTFEYESEEDNLLWCHETDNRILEEISNIKRESRMARERSEDALAWNVFRYLHKHQLFGETMEQLIPTKEKLEEPEVIYWSYSPRELGKSSILTKARKAFNELSGTEPDIIINSKRHLIFIEAKFTSGNSTKPSNEDILNKYYEAKDKWYQNVFQKDIRTVCMIMRKYELMRNYLLGSWLAHMYDKKFTLLSLNAHKYHRKGDLAFRDCIIENDQFRFSSVVWEELRDVIHGYLPDSNDKRLLLHYLHNKSAGYQNGKIVKAFI